MQQRTVGFICESPDEGPSQGARFAELEHGIASTSSRKVPAPVPRLPHPEDGTGQWCPDLIRFLASAILMASITRVHR